MEKDNKNSILQRDSSDLRAKIAEMNEKYRLQTEKSAREQAELEEFYQLEEAQVSSSFEAAILEEREGVAKRPISSASLVDSSEGTSASLPKETSQDSFDSLSSGDYFEEKTGLLRANHSSKTLRHYLSLNQYLLCLIPLIFLALFFTTASSSHQGRIQKNDFNYLGKIQNDLPNGQGAITYANGDSYQGNFLNGKFSGQGVFRSKIGQWSYSGTFSKGLPDGKGRLSTADGQSHETTFKNGALRQ